MEHTQSLIQVARLIPYVWFLSSCSISGAATARHGDGGHCGDGSKDGPVQVKEQGQRLFKVEPTKGRGSPTVYFRVSTPPRKTKKAATQTRTRETVDKPPRGQCILACAEGSSGNKDLFDAKNPDETGNLAEHSRERKGSGARM